MNTPATTLYLRADGSVLMVRGDATIELRLTPGQLMKLSLDCLQVAVAQDQAMLPLAVEILALEIPPRLAGEAEQALAASTVVPVPSCRLN